MPEGTQDAKLRRGQTLGRYTVLRRVGRGAMGEVYEAHDTALDRRVAVKVLICAPGDPQLQQSIAVREGQMLARVHHPNVVAVYDVGVADALPYIALEFVEGQPLSKWARDDVTGAQRLAMAQGLARGLVAIHEAGLIHRDIKPANILVDEQGRARLADLGVAKLMSDMAPDSSPAESTWVGTPGYWAPEVEAGEPATKASDVYSLCTAVAAVIPDPTDRTSRRLAALLRAGTSIDPQARPSAQALLDALTKERRKWLPLALGVLSLAVATTAALWPREPDPEIALQAEAQDRVAKAWRDANGVALDQWSATGPMPQRWHRKTIAQTLRTQAEEWTVAWVDASLSSETERPIAVACLERSLARLGGLVEIALGHEGATDGLLAWIVQLPGPNDCRQGSAFRGDATLWADANGSVMLPQFRRLLRADAAVYTGDLEGAQKVLDELGQVDLGGLEGHASYLRALLAFRARGSSSEAIGHYREAVLAAKAHGDRVASARATAGLSRMLAFEGRQEESLFVVREALAELGPKLPAELPTLWLIDARARTEAAYGSEEGQRQTRELLRQLEPNIDPSGYAAAMFHRASALLFKDRAEEEWLAVWDIASAQVGPAHDLTLDAWEDYVRLACIRWTASECEAGYDEYLELAEGRTVNQGPAIRIYSEALALRRAGHGGAAWALVPAVREALANATRPAETIVAGIGLADLAQSSVEVPADERREVADEAVALVSALGAPTYTEGALLSAAGVAASMGDGALVTERLQELAALPLPPNDEAAATSRELARRFMQAKLDLATGKPDAAAKAFDALVVDTRAGKTSLWLETDTLEQWSCVASFQAGDAKATSERCSIAADGPVVTDAQRERMQVLAAIGALATAPR